MRLKSLSVTNYRNFEIISLQFHAKINFLVGENGLGKTNLLDLLNTLFFKGRFSIEDFRDNNLPLKSEFSLEIESIELGLFGDYFDPANCNSINVTALQESPTENLRFFHSESGSEISSRSIRCINHIAYDSLRRPEKELSFDGVQGASRFLKHLITHQLGDSAKEELSFLNKENVSGLVESVNKMIENIRFFKEFSLKVVSEAKNEDVLSRIFLLIDNNGQKLKNSGYGLQLLALIPLAILEKLLPLIDKKSLTGIFEDDKDESRVISLFMGLDEPEIHLHPYMQRSMIRYLSMIINNEDPGFLALLKKILNIDRVIGQMIVVSHSPTVILDDYQQIIRLSQDKSGKVSVKCGSSISFPESKHKHLLKQFQYIKEAFFCRCVILVEGDTEYGALPIFSERLFESITLDSLGIGVIRADGGDSIPILMEVLKEFDIRAVAAMDRDKFPLYGSIPNIFFTTGIDFEEDIYDNFEFHDYVRYLEAEYPDLSTFFIGAAKSLGLKIDPRSRPLFKQVAALSIEEAKELKLSVRTAVIDRLRENKNVVRGRELANYVTNIPTSFSKVVTDAKNNS